MTPKETGHWLAENYGWAVLPVLGKQPVPGFLWGSMASSDHDAIEAMPWDKADRAGVHCGKSGISVLDIDTKEGRLALQKQLGGLPSTMQQQTPRGGTHLIFKAPAFEQSIGTGIPVDGVDIRSGGGIIAWYGVGDGLDWDMLPWPYSAPITKATRPRPTEMPKAASFANAEGGRNHETTREAGSILAASPGTTLPSLIDQLLRYNEQCNVPPLDTWEVEKIARSIFLKAASSASAEPEVNISVMDLGGLMSMHMDPTRFVCEPFVAEGYTLYVGPPKVGKTTLMRQLVASAHMGQDFLGYSCLKSEVLFLSLEEGQKLFRKKTLKMGYQPADLVGLRVAFDWPKGEAGINKLHEYMREHPATRLIVIDGMARIKGHAHSRQASVFDIDYAEGKALQEFAKLYPGLALIVIHHTRKMESFNPMDLVSGSNGVTAAADMVCILYRAPTGKYLMHWEGREWELDDHDFEIARDGGRWRMIGMADSHEVGLPANATLQSAIIEYLRDRGEVSGRSIARDMGRSEPTISKACQVMLASGRLLKGTLGWKLS